MKKVSAVLLGAGARGTIAYAVFAKTYPHLLEIVAVAEPVTERREAFAKEYRIPAERSFASWEEVFRHPKIADAVIICTQDRMHYAPAMKALEQGYHVLLEKPMSPNPRECIEMESAARKHNRLLSICHVMRYTFFWSAIKEVIAEGRIGEVMSVQLNENVGFYHIAHSFVRGNWRNSNQSSPMILQKSCHDMDLLAWLVGRECVRISSFGSLSHFTSNNAPAGAPERCTDGCPAESECAYSAPRFYLGEGEGWARLVMTDLSREGILQALKEGPYGRCVYRCDNNVVDHQVVNIEFAGGATATFSMCGFTHDCSRGIQIMGTKGEIRGYMEHNQLTLYDFLTKTQTEIRVPAASAGHAGGDEGIMRSFVRDVALYDGTPSLTSAQASLQSHLMAFAAEESRLNDGKPIDLSEFRRQILEGHEC